MIVNVHDFFVGQVLRLFLENSWRNSYLVGICLENLFATDERKNNKKNKIKSIPADAYRVIQSDEMH